MGPALPTPVASPALAPGHPPDGPAHLSTTRLVRLLVIGAVAAALAGAAGRVLERARLGASDAEASSRVASEVRRAIEDRATGLRMTVRTTAVAAADLVEKAATDPEAARALFDAVRRALASAPGGPAALTVYGTAATPVAWGGRPSDLPGDRLRGPSALFVVPGSNGPRLVYIEPIVDATPANRRVGAIAAEAMLAPDRGARPAASEPVLLPTSLVPASLRARYEGAGTETTGGGFLVPGPDGRPLVEAAVDPMALQALRDDYRRHTRNAAVAVLVLTLVVCAVPFVGWRDRARTTRRYVTAAATAAAIIVLARALAVAAVPPGWWWSAPGPAPWWLRLPILRSPADLLATALALVALTWLAGDAIERRRLAARHPPAPRTPARLAAFTVLNVAAGGVAAALLVGHYRLLSRAFAGTPLDPMQFSLHPFSGQRLAFVSGVLLLHAAAFWAAMLVLRAASISWRVARHDVAMRGARVALWLLPFAALAVLRPSATPAPLWWPMVATIVVTGVARWTAPRRRRASQALRLIAWLGALALPSLLFYPTMVSVGQAATERLISTRLAPEALAHRSTLQVQLRRSLAEIDRLEGLLDLVATTATVRPGEPPPTDSAYLVWQQTDLARLRLTSSVELYAGDATLVSRFALNLPAEVAATAQWTETGCQWDIFGEPLAGSEDRVLLHAGRGLCPAGEHAAPVGAILVHVMLDYATLPFLATQQPYGDLLQGGGRLQGDAHARRIEFAMYGWGRTPVFPTEGSAWPISSGLLARIYLAGREPRWAVVQRGDRSYRVFFENDRSGIYALGYPVPRPVDHLIVLAETLTLTGVVYVGLVFLTSLVARLGGYGPATGRALLREIRGSFYRKLFLAFVAAAVVPVLALALLTRAYIANQLRDSIESAAGRTASVAKRVVENVASRRRRDSGAPILLTDEVMVGVSRVITQDVNVFGGARLIATSQRDLFASGRLPTRTPAEVYRAIVLERQASYVGEERVGDFAYMLAAAPVRDGDTRTILTVPLALRQQETEREIDALDQRVLLATVSFVLLGAAIGYYMAERIADPVNRLTRATRRISRGDLDARIVTSSADEFKRLVDAFNGMAADLQRQRVELERTNRLAAWADMARQVAHDIKNPLTPIQLSAEHLRRVHHDRGEPLAPVLDSCVDTILSQVRLLRQISSEFSSFASAPVARLAPTAVNDVVTEVLQPYRSAPAGRVSIETALDDDLPLLPLDRTLLGRALVNIVENALHAMPSGGRLRIATRLEDGDVVIEVADTGMGMDAETAARLFEPYFSTRASGTGLGLTIAKRNVELNNGTIGVESAPGRGATVRVRLPVEPPPAA